MNRGPRTVFTFGQFRLDAREKALFRAGSPVAVTPKDIEILLVLVQNSGRTVEKDHLMQEVWPDTFVEESNLTVHVSQLRKALGDGSSQLEYIETVPRRGYRFLLPVEEIQEEQPVTLLERRVETRIIREEIEEDVRPHLESKRLVQVAAACLLVLSGAAIAWRLMTAESASLPTMRARPFASHAHGLQMPSFAPDGERIAFATWSAGGRDNGIYVKTMGNDPPLRLTSGPAADACPTWSPDGSTIAFLRNDAENQTSSIQLVGALGGPARKVLGVPYSRYFDLEWSPDGRYLAYAEKTDPRLPWDDFRSLAIFLLSPETRERRQFTFPPPSASDNRFAFSPDGRRLAFVRHEDFGTVMAASLWVAPVEGGEATKIYEEHNWIGHLVWAPDGAGIIFTSEREGGSKLFRIASRGGKPEALPFEEAQAYSPAVSRHGNRLAYVRSYETAELWRVGLGSFRGPAGAAEALQQTPRGATAPEFSPDGLRIAFLSGGTGRGELWVSNPDGSNSSAVVDFQVTGSTAASWSPDGKEVAFSSQFGPANSPGGVFAVNMETREVRRLSQEGYFSPSWSRDGRWVYLTSAPQRGAYQVWKVPAQDGTPVQVTRKGGLGAQESFDGKHLYYTKQFGGIWRMPVGGGDESPVLPEPIRELRSYWRITEDGIYYLKQHSPSGSALHFYEFAAGQSRPVGPLIGQPIVYGGGLTVSADRKWIVYAQSSRPGSDIILVENFR